MQLKGVALIYFSFIHMRKEPDNLAGCSSFVLPHDREVAILDAKELTMCQIRAPPEQ